MVDRGDPASTIWAPAVGPAAPRDLCTDCGISRSSDPKQCGQACQFIKPDYPALEARVHGRPRDPRREPTKSSSGRSVAWSALRWRLRARARSGQAS